MPTYSNFDVYLHETHPYLLLWETEKILQTYYFAYFNHNYKWQYPLVGNFDGQSTEINW